MDERSHAPLTLAMDFPESVRAEIAAALLQSLEPEPDADVEQAWREEVAKRLAALDPGTLVQFRKMRQARSSTAISLGLWSVLNTPKTSQDTCKPFLYQSFALRNTTMDRKTSHVWCMFASLTGSNRAKFTVH